MKAGLPLLALTLAVAACAPAAKAPPRPVASAPAPRPPVTTAPARPAPLPTVPETGWMDAPATPGDWRYGPSPSGPSAGFFSAGTPLFTMGCERDTGKMVLLRGAPGINGATRPLVIHTETVSRQLLAEADPSALLVRIDPRDPLLDAMALSKGRFAVVVEGLPTLYLPSHAEVSRVIEDCRG